MSAPPRRCGRFLAAAPAAALVDVTRREAARRRASAAPHGWSRRDAQLRHHRRRPARVHGDRRRARQLLARRRSRAGHASTCRSGPEIGQCCGGRRRRVDPAPRQTLAAGLLADGRGRADAALPHVYLFGAGHVGQALASALSLLPVATDRRRHAAGGARRDAGDGGDAADAAAGGGGAARRRPARPSWC